MIDFCLCERAFFSKCVSYKKSSKGQWLNCAKSKPCVIHERVRPTVNKGHGRS